MSSDTAPSTVVLSPLGRSARRSRTSRLLTLARRDPVIALSGLILLVMLAFMVRPQVFTRYDPVAINAMSRLKGPSSAHLFGTDQLGRDLFARVVYATRTTLGAAIVVVLCAVIVGVLVGSFSGDSRRHVDEVLMRVVDLFMAFPLLVLAMAIVAALGPGLLNAMLALVIVWWTQYARLTRGLVLQLRHREFITAASALGASRTKILYRHILPNCFSPLLVKATLDIAVAVLVTASLSFLGLGVQPPQPDWGNMVSDGRSYVQDAWWYATFPGLAIFVTVMALNLVGDAVRDYLDPRLRT